MRNTIEKNPSIDTEEAEELRFDKLELDTDQRSRHIDVWLAWKAPNLSMHHLIEQINQDIKRDTKI